VTPITAISIFLIAVTIGAVVWLMGRDFARALEQRLNDRERFFELNDD
jgi:prophage antirepressor-like protein